jgi:geranylgeranyl pyrophosphate synthase
VASVNSAMIEIVSAEALESALWCKKQVMPEEYFEVIRLKATVAELHCKIGGLLANTNLKTLELLMHYGRAIGILSTLKEEFVDMVNPVELKHRIAHELPPYPMLCALQDEEVGEQLGIFVSKGSLQSKDGGCIAKLVLGCAKVKMMETDFRKLGREEFATNVLLKSEMCRELSVLLEALYKELSVV